ncbi:MAG: DNA topoisomerase I, partial [Bacteroidales bacterium]|nr:DNA topoisomerase I [Bacteroidales bacterium]
AQGLEKWTAMMADFYTPFHRQVLETAKHSEKVSGERLLGNDPVSGEPIYVKLSRFGPVAQKGETKGDQKPLFAGLKKGQTLESVTLEEALDLFKLPRRVGLFEDEEMVAAVGRFGPYIRHKGMFYSIPKGDDPITLTQERAVEIIEQKRQADANRVIKTFAEDASIQVLNGRFGPYIACNKKNYKIDKKTDAASLTLDECRAIIEAGASTQPAAKRRAGVRMAAAKVKTTKTAAKTGTRKTK